MPATRYYNGDDCPDCGCDRINRTTWEDVEERLCFECGARWIWTAHDPKPKRRPGNGTIAILVKDDDRSGLTGGTD
jgi:hypothetical protein